MSAGATLDHRALLYSSEESFLEFAAPFLRGGLERGEVVYAPVSPGHERALRDCLGEDAAAIRFERPESFYATPIPTMTNHAAALLHRPDDAPSVRALGEIPWVDRADVAVREWSRVEALFDHAFARVPAKAVCAYDERTLPDAILDVAWHSHARLEGWNGGQASPSYRPGAAHLETLLGAPLPEPRGRVAELEFDSHPAPARHFAAARAVEAGLGPDQVENLELAVGEAASNAIRHGEAPRRLRLWTDDLSLVCEISDGGPGFDDVLAGVLRPEAASEGGWGLWLAHYVCDYVELRSFSDRTVVRLHLRRHAALHLE